MVKLHTSVMGSSDWFFHVFLMAFSRKIKNVVDAMNREGPARAYGWLMIHRGWERSILETRILTCQNVWHMF